VDQLSLGVMARSRKEDERRLPIHPMHVERIDADLRARIYLEQGYGERFGVPDEHLAPLVGGLRSREELIDDCDVILLAKPLAEDLSDLRRGQTVWGWAHCVQNESLTQSAVDRRLTVIALEGMTHAGANGAPGLNVFHMNQELAGYCSVVHAMAIRGTTGHYGRRLRAAVIAVATAMQESGLENISYGDRDSLGLFQQRPSMGWGTAAQITTPSYAADAFLSALATHQKADPGWAGEPLWATAQAVQKSGFPTAYAKWEKQAAQLVTSIATKLA